LVVKLPRLRQPGSGLTQAKAMHIAPLRPLKTGNANLPAAAGGFRDAILEHGVPRSHPRVKDLA